MPHDRIQTLKRVLTWAGGLLALKVTVSIVLRYVDYFPPNFASDFLGGREAYFFGAYRWAFYAHLVSGPICLVLGIILISESFRRRFLKAHRLLGRFQVALILLLLAPSGLWMAFYAAPGPTAAAGFAVLALLTGISAGLGWRSAVKRRIAEHRRWMWRCFLLLSSAVVLRLMVGLSIVTGFYAEWLDPAVSWACWILPLAVFETLEWLKGKQISARQQPARSTVVQKSQVG